MKNLILILSFVFLLVGSLFAAPYWHPRQYLSSDQQISTTQSVISDMSIYYRGVTIGDGLYFRNGLTPSSPVFYTFIAPTASGTFDVRLPKKDWIIGDGIYMDVEVSTGGVFGVSIDYQ